MNYFYPNPNPYGYYGGGYTGGYYPFQQQTTDMSDEQSYIENILRLNLGKMVSVYMNFENSQWGSKIFKGKLEAAGKDHIIISDPSNNMRYLLLTIYLN
ncbi:MAG: spore coat protein GerQ, partial [Anaeroplasmataceae bacterium]|nr:spore coat protein GerQ [Anaeroplasmataceae bacterium]